MIFAWFLFVLGIIALSRKATVRLDPQSIVRIAFRSFALSLLLAPTVVYAGIVGFPAPASMVVAACLIFPKWVGDLTRWNLFFALALLFATWLVIALILVLLTRRKAGKNHTTSQ